MASGRYLHINSRRDYVRDSYTERLLYRSNRDEQHYIDTFDRRRLEAVEDLDRRVEQLKGSSSSSFRNIISGAAAGAVAGAVTGAPFAGIGAIGGAIIGAGLGLIGGAVKHFFNQEEKAAKVKSLNNKRRDLLRQQDVTQQRLYLQTDYTDDQKEAVANQEALRKDELRDNGQIRHEELELQRASALLQYRQNQISLERQLSDEEEGIREQVIVLDEASTRFSIDNLALSEKYAIATKTLGVREKILDHGYDSAEFAKDQVSDRVVDAKVERNAVDVVDLKSGTTAADSKLAKDLSSMEQLAAKYSADSALNQAMAKLEFDYVNQLTKLSGEANKLGSEKKLLSVNLKQQADKLTSQFRQTFNLGQSKIAGNENDIDEVNELLGVLAARQHLSEDNFDSKKNVIDRAVIRGLAKISLEADSKIKRLSFLQNQQTIALMNNDINRYNQLTQSALDLELNVGIKANQDFVNTIAGFTTAKSIKGLTQFFGSNGNSGGINTQGDLAGLLS